MRRTSAPSEFLLLLALLPGTLQPESAWARQADPSAEATAQVAADDQEQGAPQQADTALFQEAGAAMDRLEEIQDSIRTVIDLIEAGMAGNELDLIRIGLAPMVEESLGLMEDLPGLIRRIEEDGGDTQELRQRLGDVLGWFSDQYRTVLERVLDELAALAAAQDTSSEGGLADLAARSQEARDRFLRDGSREVDLLAQAQEMGLLAPAKHNGAASPPRHRSFLP